MLSRRNLISISLGVGLASHRTLAKCLDIKNADNLLALPDHQVAVWSDGPPEHTRLAIQVQRQQTQNDYIDKIILSDSKDQLIAADYPTATTKLGYHPYFIIPACTIKQKYYLTIQTRGKTAAVYRYTITAKRLQTRLAHLQLPPSLHKSLQEAPHNGQIYSILDFPQKWIPYEAGQGITTDITILHPYPEFFPRAHLSANNKLELSSPSGPGGETPRYMLVTDPVGRLISGGPHTKNWNYADLNDCAYIMIFAEFPNYGLFQTNLQLY